jgi:predicted AlkP superfamily pyrophosphatase or phosphodiesterase
MRVRVRAWLWVVLLALAGCAPARLAESPAPAASRAGSGGVNRPEHRNAPHIILISFDGFRSAYLDRFDLPNFKKVLARGTRARTLLPVFPSLTFPNHYSLVTGLTAERHGIVANSFYDPERRASYSFRDQASVTDGSWYRGEPIWVTAETQGMVAACYFWPGSEAAIKGVRPTFWNKYDGSVPADTRVRTVLEWLQLSPERRPHIITLYFSELDTVSHQNALDSPAIEGAARSLDRSLGALLDGLDALPVKDRVYLLLTSDHGMVDTSPSQTILLNSLFDSEDARVGYSGPVAGLYVAGGPAAAERLRDRINARLEHGRAYRREDLPERYRFRADPRIGDVVIVMDESWMVIPTPPGTNRERWGMHGWDPALPSMHALFVAAGPDIPAGATVPTVENIDVYPFMTELLGLRTPGDIDGHRGRIRELMSKPSLARDPVYSPLQ